MDVIVNIIGKDMDLFRVGVFSKVVVRVVGGCVVWECMDFGF